MPSFRFIKYIKCTLPALAGPVDVKRFVFFYLMDVFHVLISLVKKFSSFPLHIQWRRKTYQEVLRNPRCRLFIKLHDSN